MGSGKDGWKPAGLHSELPQRGVSPRSPVQAGPKGRDCGGAVPLRVEKTKANRPVSRILYPAEAGRRSFLWAAELLPGSSDLPESYPRPLPGGVGWSEPLLLSYLVLLHVGFPLPRPSPSGRCALTLSSRRNRTISPLPRLATGRYIFCGTFRTCLPLAPERKRPGKSWPLASTLLCGVRTFLPARKGRSDRPACSPNLKYGRFTGKVQRRRREPRSAGSDWPHDCFIGAHLWASTASPIVAIGALGL